MTDQKAVKAKDGIRDYVSACIDEDKVIDWSVVYGIIANEYVDTPDCGECKKCHDFDRLAIACHIAQGLNANPNVWYECNGCVQPRIDIVAESISQTDSLLAELAKEK